MWVFRTVTSLLPGAAALKPLQMNTVTDALRKYFSVKRCCSLLRSVFWLFSYSRLTQVTVDCILYETGVLVLTVIEL